MNFISKARSKDLIKYHVLSINFTLFHFLARKNFSFLLLVIIVTLNLNFDNTSRFESMRATGTIKFHDEKVKLNLMMML
jgi:hypothetical protein